AQIRLDREAERGLIYGQRVTLGRLFTGGLARVGVIEPHDNWYRVGSGLIDVVPQVVDPAALALGGIGKAAQARKIFVGAKAVGAARQAERAAVSTAKLRSLAATFGVRGRGHMDRGRLLNALSIHVDDPKNMKVTDLRKLATTFNITGRTRMAKADLVERVSHRMANLDEVIKPSPVVQQIQATPAPLAFAAGAAEAVRATGVPKLLEKAGIIKGTVARHVHGPSIEAWLQGTHGQRVLREIALTGDAAEIWRLTGKKLTRQEVRALRDASTPTEVADVLRPMLGGRTMRTVDDVWKTGRYHSIPKATDLAEARLLTDVPGHQIDTQDPMAPMREVEAWLRNAHVESEVVNEFLSKVAETDTYDELFEVVEEVMAHTDGVLAKA
ncbi:MAG: hypothetical protein GWO22_15475, partial [Actinobacteria bacterium]|nr:hypothetical protein [Actinomycetota bacterium]